jgi:hypothetical protein
VLLALLRAVVLRSFFYSGGSVTILQTMGAATPGYGSQTATI